MPDKNDNDTFVGCFCQKKPVSSGQCEQQMASELWPLSLHSCLVCYQDKKKSSKHILESKGAPGVTLLYLILV
jgi:hypothetical protein